MNPELSKIRLERNASGGSVAPASLIAAHFGWSETKLKEKMQRGLVVSIIEQGQDKDEGYWRLSVRCGNRRWQAIIDDQGEIARQHFEFISFPPLE